MKQASELLFEQVLRESLKKGHYVKVAFFNSYHEFHSVNAVMKSCASGIMLTTGELITEDQIVSLNEITSPDYQHILDFTCDC